MLISDEGCGGFVVECVPAWEVERRGRRVRGRLALAVLRVAVPSEVHLALESLLAQTTRKGLVPGVLAHVSDKVRALAERLRAHHTLVRLLTCNI